MSRRSFVMRMRTPLIAALTAIAVGFTVPTAPTPSSPDGAERPAKTSLIQQMFFLKKMKPDAERIGVIWKEGLDSKTTETAKRAVASIKGKLFVGPVQSTGDVAEQFRVLTDEHDIQVLWIVKNDGVVDGSTSRKYLIKNAIEKGIPLLAPTKDWVDAGAPVAFDKANGETRILLNEPAANATALKVPSEYEGKTELIASAN